MKKNYFLLLLVVLTLLGGSASAQLFGTGSATTCYLPGRFLEIGILNNGAFGAPDPPATYFPDPGPSLAEVYDYGHDGWDVGSPGYYGDYTFPGGPFEGWELQVNGVRSQAFCTGSTSTITGGTLTGSLTSYVDLGGELIANWTGTASGGSLAVQQQTRVDTNGSAVVVTVILKNTSATDIPGVYYLRSCDPDNDQTNSGDFETDNTVIYQNDTDHRVMVQAAGTVYTDALLALSTKDCRAVAFVYSSWPISSVDLGAIWSGTSTDIGSSDYTINDDDEGDIAIGLVYNIGTIAAGDSTVISYAYVFNGASGIDSAFPDPALSVVGTSLIDYDLDTLNPCLYPATDTFPVKLLYASDKNWTWSHWHWAPDTGLSADTGINNVIHLAALTGPITYTVTGTDSAYGNCAAKTLYLTVIPCFLAVSNSAICSGDTLRFNALGDSVGATYHWYGPAGFTSNIKRPEIDNATVADTGTYYVVRHIGTVVDTSHTYVIIKPRPVIVLTNNGPLCPGDNLNLAITPVSAGETFTWTGPLSFTSTTPTATVTGVTLDNAGIYKLVASLNGCPDSSTETVVINPTPATPVAGSNSPVCSGTILMLNASDATSGVTYSWTGPAGFTSAVQDPTIAAVPVSDTGTYSVVATSLGCPSLPGTTVVVVIPAPDVPVVSSNTPVCTGAPLNLSAISAPAATYSWTGPTGFVSGGATPTIIHAALSNAGIYSVTVTLNGCTTSGTTNVVVNQTPDPPIVANLSYCQYDSALALTAVGTSLSWYTTPSGGVGVAEPPVPPTNTQYVATWFVTQTILGCESNRAPLQINVYYKPIVTILQSKSFACIHDTATFVYSGTPDVVTLAGVAANYVWTIPVGATIISGVPYGPGPLIIRFDSSSNHEKVTLTISDGGNGKLCTGTDTLDLPIIATPYLGIYAKQTACVGDTVTVSLDDRSDNAYVYTWDFGGGTVVLSNHNTGGPYEVVWSTPGQHVIEASTATIQGCKSLSTMDTVNIHTLPEAQVSLVNTPASICTGDSLEFRSATATDGYSYTWTPAPFFNVNNLPDIWGTPGFAGYVTLTVSDEFGCKASDSIMINAQPCCGVFFPSAFTPNGDTKNDVFRPITAGNHKIHSFRIVDRWGQLMYNSDDEHASWDGRYNGVPQDMGVYYYFIRYDCNGSIIEEKGDVTLIR